MVKKILLGLAGLIFLILILAAFQPATFRIQRSISIHASAEKVFPYINNLHNWQSWSPWAKLDPNAKIQYDGPEEGVGSSFSWEGNKDIGAGKMTIAESKPISLVQYKLDFLKPFAANHMAEFTFVTEGENTSVTWSMWGNNNYLAKIFSLVMDCEKMVGPDFEKGLQQLKDLVEKP